MRSDNDRKVFGGLIEVRGACQYLQMLLNSASKGKVNSAVLTQVDAKVSPALKGIRQVFATDPIEAEWAADFLVYIELAWAQVMALAPVTGTPSDKAAEMLKQMDATLDDIVYHCCSLTLSPRVNDILSNLRVGQALDVEFEMGQELPRNPVLRKRLIDELAQQGGAVECGLVDSEVGVIYKAEPTRRLQFRSVVWLALLLVAGLGVPFLLSHSWNLESWPIPASRQNELLVAYLAVLAGSGIHLALDALKAAHSQKRPDFHDTHDWILWVHVHASQLTYGILWILTGYVLLVFSVTKLDWQTALFAGYSIDSITDLFIGRFQKLAATRVKAITGTSDTQDKK